MARHAPERAAGATTGARQRVPRAQQRVAATAPRRVPRQDDDRSSRARQCAPRGGRRAAQWRVAAAVPPRARARWRAPRGQGRPARRMRPRGHRRRGTVRGTPGP
ncbi:hypothetical protein [Streptomyces thioluteus]|uniref:hypothetical protein n=1 Tax=Streptomyces thioluteus TaxID=66431 RepID=UPI0031ED49F8